MPNLSRKNMPQVKTQDLGKALDMVADKVRVTKETIPASKLKKSQKELYKDKVKGIANRFNSPKDMKPLIISKDNHIVDGHHRWGAAIYKWGEDVKIPVHRINLTIDNAIKLYKHIADTINEAITIPIEIGDTVLGGKFKNKRIVVKSIDKNEKGDITINGKPLLKFRLVNESTGASIQCSNCNHSWEIEVDDDRPYFCHNCGYDAQSQKVDLVGLKNWKDSLNEANAVSGGKVHKFITGKNLTFKGKKYPNLYFEVLRIDNKSKLVTLKILSPKELFGKELDVPFKTIRRGPFLKTDTSGLGESTINEIPMGDLQKIDQFADKKLNPVDVVLTDKHFFDRLNDPRNGKEISQAELIGFFKRLSKKRKEFVEFLNQYNSLVAVDDRTNINIPFMKQSNKAIAKTIMRKKDFKSSDKKLDI